MAPPLELSGLNTGYVGQLLEQYLDNPEAVDPAWREIFENADERVLAALPGLTRLVGRRSTDGGNGTPPASVLVETPSTTAGEVAEPRLAPALESTPRSLPPNPARTVGRLSRAMPTSPSS